MLKINELKILLTFISRIKILKNVKYSRIKCLQITRKYQNFLQIGSSHFTPNITNLSSSKQSQSSH